MKKRIAVALLAMLFVLSGLICRMSLLSGKNALVKAAVTQSSTVLEVAQTRGVIYDRYLRPLTNATGEYKAAVMPNNQSADALLKAVRVSERPKLYTQLEALIPFVCTVDTDAIYAKGIDVFWVPTRYEDTQSAVHIIGQCDTATGKGASGIEYSYDTLLTASGGSLKLRYLTDAMKRGIDGVPPEIINTGYYTGAGVALTLDRSIQTICEQASRTIQKGAVVVMDCQTGDILASVSKPSYNPNDPSDAVKSPDSPFINRAFYAYPVGSIFKLLTAATAIEQGFTTEREFTCTGALKVGDNVFHCHYLPGHGTLDMTKALEKSCNPYFISLALEIGGPNLLYKAEQLGFGSASELAPKLKTKPGSLPGATDLLAPAVTANFGFGQGELTATPIQMAVLISSMANGGKAVTPRLVEGATTQGTSFSSHTARFEPRQIILRQAANQVRDMMISVVETGSGKAASPLIGGAGGKTASAQTGRFINDEEAVHAWFSGFYPAYNPRYSIVVLVEDGDSGGDAAAPVFKEIADGIALLLNTAGEDKQLPQAAETKGAVTIPPREN